MKNWSSEYYAHFEEPKIVVDKGIVKYRFVCKAYVPPLSIQISFLPSGSGIPALVSVAFATTTPPATSRPT